MDLPELKYNEAGLIPCIVQDADTGEVLMMAWMSAESLALTLERGETVFWSRSRRELWHKGAHERQHPEAGGSALRLRCRYPALRWCIRPAPPAIPASEPASTARCWRGSWLARVLRSSSKGARGVLGG